MVTTVVHSFDVKIEIDEIDVGKNFPTFNRLSYLLTFPGELTSELEKST